MKIWISVLGIIFIAFACYPRSYQATAHLQGGLSVTYTIIPEFGFHSDWTREIRIKSGSEEISQKLFEDTGWWRGSNLYQHKSGVYVIHEGQIGCFGFRLEPLSFDIQESISCEKNKNHRKEQTGASPFYVDLTYLGTFVETPNAPSGEPISFISAAEKQEEELPDLL